MPNSTLLGYGGGSEYVSYVSKKWFLNFSEAFNKFLPDLREENVDSAPCKLHHAGRNDRPVDVNVCNAGGGCEARKIFCHKWECVVQLSTPEVPAEDKFKC